jgi:hypothetical protein
MQKTGSIKRKGILITKRKSIKPKSTDMRIIIFCIALLSSVITQAQKDIAFADPLMRVVVNDSLDVAVMTSISGKEIIIHGDTMAAIRMLLDRIGEEHKKKNEVKDALHKAVLFSNTVVDYFKKSKEWKDFVAAIETQGYFRTPPPPVKKKK